MSDTSTVATPPFVPSAPFDVSSPDADTILRSSDNVDFRVHRSILSVVSPFFKDMFSLPQPASEPDIPVIRVSESAVVLDSALRMWYPGAEAAGSETLDVLRAALEAFIVKYDMQFLIPTAKTRLRAHLDADAVAVFVIACRLKWKDIALEAAKATLKQPLRVFDSPRNPQLSGIGADLYDSLLYYHAQCGVVASSSISSLEWCELWRGEFPGGSCPVPSRCWDCHPGIVWMLSKCREVIARKWSATYMAELANILERAPSAPLDSSALMLRAHELSHSDTCPDCQRDGLKHVVRFTALLKARIQEQLDSVQLNLDF